MNNENEVTALALTLDKCREIVGCPAGVDLQDWVKQLAAENVVRQEFVKICFRAAADGASLDGADIQEIGERLGLFGRETYQPVLHGYICGHEAGEDSVYVMKSAPATGSYLAGIKADAVNYVAHKFRVRALNSLPVGGWVDAARAAEEFAKQLREGADK